MPDEPIAEPLTPPPLGPGEDHPDSPAAGAPVVSRPLGPGDDDPQSPAGHAAAIVAPLGPGDSDPKSPDANEGFHIVTPGPAGPGDTFSGPRHVVRVPVKRASAAEAPTVAAVDVANDNGQETEVG